jgi:hypothetical protein
MERAKVSDWIVLTMLWTMIVGLVMVAIWLTFGWMVESFGRATAVATFFAVGGVILAIFLWVASSRHTVAIMRSTLSFAADTHEANVQALRSLSSVQREDARTHRIREQGRVQIEVAGYRAALADARQEVRREWQNEQRQATPAPTPTWAMGADEDGEGEGFNWVK